MLELEGAAAVSEALRERLNMNVGNTARDRQDYAMQFKCSEIHSSAVNVSGISGCLLGFDFTPGYMTKSLQDHQFLDQVKQTAVATKCCQYAARCAAISC